MLLMFTCSLIGVKGIEVLGAHRLESSLLFFFLQCIFVSFFSSSSVLADIHLEMVANNKLFLISKLISIESAMYRKD